MKYFLSLILSVLFGNVAAQPKATVMYHYDAHGSLMSKKTQIPYKDTLHLSDVSLLGSTSKVSAGPNPAHNLVNIVVKDCPIGATITYKLVHSGNGKVVLWGKVLETSFTMDISSLETNIYFLTLEYADKIEHKVIAKY